MSAGTRQSVHLRRGDMRRRALLEAARGLLTRVSFDELSVSDISRNAGVTRTGFYFYFETKYSVLAAMFENVCRDIVSSPKGFDFARDGAETAEACVERALTSATSAFERHRDVLTACLAARNSSDEIEAVLDRELHRLVELITAKFAGGDLRGDATASTAPIVRVLIGTTMLTLAGDSAFVGSACAVPDGLLALKSLWLEALAKHSIRT